MIKTDDIAKELKSAIKTIGANVEETTIRDMFIQTIYIDTKVLARINYLKKEESIKATFISEIDKYFSKIEQFAIRAILAELNKYIDKDDIFTHDYIY